MSTATDIDAPATEQGAGLLNVLAAVKEAKSIGSGHAVAATTTTTSGGGLLLNPGQINVVQDPGDTSNQSVQVTNTGADPVTVNLSTRALRPRPSAIAVRLLLHATRAHQRRPVRPTPGRSRSGAVPNEVYQDEHFTVPATSGPSRLEFAADYQDTAGVVAPLRAHRTQRDLRRVLRAAGTRRLRRSRGGQSAARQVDGGVLHRERRRRRGATGTSGTIQWSADTCTYVAGGNIVPATLDDRAGADRLRAPRAHEFERLG